MDKSGDLHEKNIDPRDTGLSMKIILFRNTDCAFLVQSLIFVIFECQTRWDGKRHPVILYL